MPKLYWGEKECPHCGKDVQPQFAGLEQLVALFDAASREHAESAPMAITCPHCCGMIRMVLEPTVTIVTLSKLELAPMRLSPDNQPLPPARKIVHRTKSA